MPQQFADKYLLAVEQALKEKPQGGLNGFEQEWNLLDEELLGYSMKDRTAVNTCGIATGGFALIFSPTCKWSGCVLTSG